MDINIKKVSRSAVEVSPDTVNFNGFISCGDKVIRSKIMERNIRIDEEG